jgi:hypothetical protein
MRRAPCGGPPHTARRGTRLACSLAVRDGPGGARWTDDAAGTIRSRRPFPSRGDRALPALSPHPAARATRHACAPWDGWRYCPRAPGRPARQPRGARRRPAPIRPGRRGAPRAPAVDAIGPRVTRPRSELRSPVPRAVPARPSSPTRDDPPVGSGTAPQDPDAAPPRGRPSRVAGTRAACARVRTRAPLERSAPAPLAPCARRASRRTSCRRPLRRAPRGARSRPTRPRRRAPTRGRPGVRDAPASQPSPAPSAGPLSRRRAGAWPPRAFRVTAPPAHGRRPRRPPTAPLHERESSAPRPSGPAPDRRGSR